MKHIASIIILMCFPVFLYPQEIPGNVKFVNRPEMVDPDAAKSYKNDPSLINSLSANLPLKNGTVKLNIFFEKGQDQVARYSRDKLMEYLPQVEKVLDRPLAPSNKIINLYGKGAVMLGYEDINSWFKDNYESPALLFHEFGHLWFARITNCGDWFDQGVVSFLPVALYKAKLLSLTPKEAARLYSAWDFANTKPDDDFPLNQYSTLPKYKIYSSIIYRKSFKVQYLIFLELGGPEAYFKFLKILLTKPTNTDQDILNALNKVKIKDWNRFLSGWVFKGPYRDFNLNSFNDQDLDNLTDVEEHYYGTDKLKADTDNDGYSDYWEIQNGLDPLDEKSKGDPDVPAVDGVVDTLSFPPVKTIKGIEGNAKASCSIRLLEVYPRRDKIFVRVHFYKKEKKRVLQTVHLKNLNGQNYWIQSGDMKGFWIAEFKDGIPFEQWSASKIAPDNIRMSDGDVFEFEFIPSDFALGNEFALTYYSGGFRNNESVWDSDYIESGVIYRKKPTIAIDGNLEDMESKINLQGMKQVQGNKQPYLDFDLKELMAGVRDSRIYIGASFNQIIKQRSNSVITFHIQFPDEGANYWVQFSGKSLVGFSYFRDGTAYNDWTSLKKIRKETASIRLDLNESLESMIPLDVFSEVKNRNRIRIKSS